MFPKPGTPEWAELVARGQQGHEQWQAQKDAEVRSVADYWALASLYPDLKGEAVIKTGEEIGLISLEEGFGMYIAFIDDWVFDAQQAAMEQGECPDCGAPLDGEGLCTHLVRMAQRDRLNDIALGRDQF